MLETSKEDFESAKRVAADVFEEAGGILLPFCLIRWKGEDGNYRRELLQPTALVVTRQGAERVTLTGPQFAEAVRQAAAQVKADFVVLVMEVWLAQSTGQTIEEAQAERAKYGRVEDMPNRKEAVCLMVEDAGGREMWRAWILRGDQTARLTDWQNEEGVAYEGRMTRLLPQYQQEVN